MAFYLGGGKNGAINRKNASHVSSYTFSMRVYGMNVPLQKMCVDETRIKFLSYSNEELCTITGKVINKIFTDSAFFFIHLKHSTWVI